MFGLTKTYSGVFFSSEKGTFYVTSSLKKMSPFSATIQSYGVIDSSNEKTFAEGLEALKTTATVGVLDSADYQLIRVERPAVDAKNMEQELLWAVQDQMAFEEDDAIFRWFPCPISGSQKEFVFAVIISHERLSRRINFLRRLQCNIVDLIIPELAKSALLCPEVSKDEYAAYVDLSEEAQSLLVVRDGQLLLSKALPKSFLMSDGISEETVKELIQVITQTMNSISAGSSYKIVMPDYVSFGGEPLSQSSMKESVKILEARKYFTRRVEERSMLINGLIAQGGIFSYVRNM